MSGRELGGIGGAFLRAAASHPDRVAVVDGREIWTFAELADRVHRIAHRLTAMGLARGDAVIVALPRSADQYATILAVLLSGGAYVPVDPTLPRARATSIIARSRARLMVADQAWLDVELPTVRPGDVSAESTIASPVDVTACELAYIIYTSGTTGQPKGVMVSHVSVLRFLDDLESMLGAVAAPARVACNASLAFDASVQQWIRLCRGDTLVLVPDEVRADPEALVRHLQETGVTDLDLTPSQLRVMLPHISGTRLERVLLGGEAIDPSLWDAVRTQGAGIRYVNVYGPTESTVDAFCAEVANAEPTPTIGAPLHSVRAALLGHDLEPCTVGEPGEIFLAGPRLAWGYHDDPRQTAIRFIPDIGGNGERHYRTGDRAFVDGDRWHTLGRVDDQWKINGIRIEAGEVAAAVRGLPGISAAEVVRHPETGRVHGFVVGKPPTDWRVRLTPALFPAAVPAELTPLPHIPLTVSGKADHRALLDRLHEVARTPSGELTDTLERLWHRFAGGVRDGVDFIGSGGHSLAAIQFLDNVEREFHVRLSLHELYQCADLSAFRRLLDDAEHPPTPSAAPRRMSPATPEQQALFVLHQLHAGITAYHVGSLDRLSGPLRPDRLGGAVSDVVAATDALRSRLRLLNDRLAVVLGPDGEEPKLEWEELKLSAHDEAAEQFLEKPFSLLDGALFRAKLWSTPDGFCHTLVLVGHHVVLDGWSLENVRALITAAYRGDEWSAPPAFLDWVADHSREIAALDPEAVRRAAHAHDSDRARPIQITGPRPKVARFRGERSQSHLSDAAWGRLRAIAHDQQTTPFAALLALWFVILSRYTGANEVVTGIPTAGAADFPRRGEAVGFFNETVPVRQEVRADDTLRDLLQRCSELVRAVVRDPQVPFPRIVEALPHRRAMGENPVFSTWCNLLSYPWHDWSFDGVDAHRMDDPVARPLFDLNVYFRERAGALDVDIVFDRDLHTADRIEALRRQLHSLLERAPELLDTRIADIALEYAPVTATGPEPGAPLVDVGARILTAFDEHAEHPLLHSTGATATYAQIGARVRTLATTIADTVPRGGLILIDAARSANTVERVLASLIADRPFLIVPDNAPPIRRERLHATPFARWRLGDAGPEAVGTGPLLGNDVAYLCATSGTTGEPKLVLAPRNGLDLMLAWQPHALGVVPGDRLSVLSGLGHDPLLREILIAVTSGAELFLPDVVEAAQPDRLAKWLESTGITVLHTTPAMGRLIAEAARARAAPLRAVRCVSLAGAAVSDATARALRQGIPSARVLSTYGTTETVQVASAVEVGRDGCATPRPLIASSSPAAHLTVETEAGTPSAVNEPGEIVVRGPALFLGYVGASDAAPANVYRTGDRGVRRPDGFIEFLGRGDRQVSRFGLRTELGEIEATLRSHPLIEDAYVVALVAPGSEDEPRLVAVASPLMADEDALMEWLANRLPPNALPDRFVTVDTIPLTPNGKPDIGLVVEQTRPRRVSGTVAEIIAQTVARLVDVPTLDVSRNFFEAGATSLTLLRAHSEIRDATGVDFAVTEMFRNPSARTLAARIRPGR